MTNYDIEAKKRFGNTDAYKEYAQKTAGYGADKQKAVADGLLAIFKKFADCKNEGSAADSPAAQALVKKLQDYISENYYTCTNEILAGLSQMYVCDERFSKNIDKNGTGTAAFASDAIKFYCKGAVL